MTITKAIEILTDLLGEGPLDSPNDRRDAVKLGIEALKHMLVQRQFLLTLLHFHPPGETEQ